MAHETVASKLPRTSFNPLFPINLTDAMARDNNGRLRRRSWLVSKSRLCLRDQLELFAKQQLKTVWRTRRDVEANLEKKETVRRDAGLKSGATLIHVGGGR